MPISYATTADDLTTTSDLLRRTLARAYSRYAPGSTTADLASLPARLAAIREAALGGDAGAVAWLGEQAGNLRALADVDRVAAEERQRAFRMHHGIRG